MKSEWPLGDLDEIQFGMKCSIAALGAVHECMADGRFTAENYTDALYAIYVQLSSLNEKMREAVNAEFESRRVQEGATTEREE